MHDLIPLHLMTSGQTASVASVIGGSAEVHRLREMGLRDGTQIEMVRPGSPCIIRLDGTRLCFRANNGTRVLVRTAECA